MKNGFKARVQFASFISTIDLALGITISQSLTVLAPISFCLGNVTHFFEANVDLRFRNLSAHNSHNPPFRRTLVWRFITFQLRWILLRLGDVSTWSSYIVYYIYYIWVNRWMELAATASCLLRLGRFLWQFSKFVEQCASWGRDRRSTFPGSLVSSRSSTSFIWSGIRASSVRGFSGGHVLYETRSGESGAMM